MLMTLLYNFLQTIFCTTNNTYRGPLMPTNTVPGALEDNTYLGPWMIKPTWGFGR